MYPLYQPFLFLLQVFHPSGWCGRSRSSESVAPSGSAEGLWDQLLFQALCIAAELSSVEQFVHGWCYRRLSSWLHSTSFLFLSFPCLLIAPMCRSPSVVLLSLLCVSSGWQSVLNSVFSLLYEKAEQLSFIVKKIPGRHEWNVHMLKLASIVTTLLRKYARLDYRTG
jgi:hypothetical protein